MEGEARTRRELLKEIEHLRYVIKLNELLIDLYQIKEKIADINLAKARHKRSNEND